MDFLTKLYAEEKEKNASAELEQLYKQMSVSQLEDVLGIKTAGNVKDLALASLLGSAAVGGTSALVDKEHVGRNALIGAGLGAGGMAAGKMIGKGMVGLTNRHLRDAAAKLAKK